MAGAWGHLAHFLNFTCQNKKLLQLLSVGVANLLMDYSVMLPSNFSPQQKADLKKDTGNKFFRCKKFLEAKKCYTQAIELNPECPTYYSNRCACNMATGSMQLALDDAAIAIKIDSTFTKAYVRLARCQLALGDASSVMRAVDKIRELDPGVVVKDLVDGAQLVQKCERDMDQSYEKQDYRRTIYNCNQAMVSATHCPRFKILKAECLGFLRSFEKAEELLTELDIDDNNKADVLYVRGVCLFYQDELEKAVTQIQEALHSVQDHTKAKLMYRRMKNLKQKKEAGNESFKNSKFQEAYDLYTEALQIDLKNQMTNAKLYNNRALACIKLNRSYEAVADCTTAIQLDDKYVKAYLRRAKVYQDLEMHEESVEDYKNVVKLDRTEDHQKLLAQAILELEKFNMKDYYEILGIEPSANLEEIKKAYKYQALVHHPDRHANASDDVKQAQERKFKLVGNVYAVLTDPFKKAEYDRGRAKSSDVNFTGCRPPAAKRQRTEPPFMDQQRQPSGNVNRTFISRSTTYQHFPSHGQNGNFFCNTTGSPWSNGMFDFGSNGFSFGPYVSSAQPNPACGGSYNNIAFRYTTLSNATFYNVTVQYASLTNVTLVNPRYHQYTTFSGNMDPNLANASYSCTYNNATLQHCTLNNVKLVNPSLQYCRLCNYFISNGVDEAPPQNDLVKRVWGSGN